MMTGLFNGYELVLFFASFHEMVLFCVTEAILQDCLIFSVHVTHVITLHIVGVPLASTFGK